MECGMRKKGVPEALFTAVMSLHNGARTKVNARAHFSEEIGVNAGVHQGSVLSPLSFRLLLPSSSVVQRRRTTDEDRRRSHVL